MRIAAYARHLTCVSLLASCFVACMPFGKFAADPDHTLRFSNYVILGRAAAFNGNNISAQVPWSGLTGLVPTFSTNAVRIEVGGVAQTSGVTVVDLSAPVTYNLTGQDGATRAYVVTGTVVFPIADTGQTSCYNGTAAQACADVSWPKQDGDVLDKPRARSFTGPTQYLATGDYTTTDNVTGLVWKTCPQGLTGASCAGTLAPTTFAGATTVCTGLNAGAGYAGLTNWRVPTMHELQTLIEYGVYAPAINATAFPGSPATTPAAFFWSSTAHTTVPANAWYGDFAYGGLSNTAKTTSYSLRCVSGTPTAYTPPLQDNNDGTISDTVNGLVWQKCNMGETFNNVTLLCQGLATTSTWQVGLSYCNALSWGGRTNWRMPSLNEIFSLIDFTQITPATRTLYFPTAVAGSNYLSSTTNASFPSAMQYVYFTEGIINNQPKTSTYNARCVTDQ